LSTRDHEGRTYLTIRAEQITLLGGGKSDERPAQRDPARQAPVRDDLGDDLPF
jgi:single-strand DNA-binding protein